MNIVLIGLFGSGKSTLASVLADKFGLKIISSVQFCEYLDKHNHSYSRKGGDRPPFEFFDSFIKEYCGGKTGFVFDNIYTMDGMRAVNETCKIDRYFHLDIDQETARARTIARGRDDVGEPFFQRRTQAFNENIVLFKKLLGDKLVTLDATLPMETLHAKVIDMCKSGR